MQGNEGPPALQVHPWRPWRSMSAMGPDATIQAPNLTPTSRRPVLLLRGRDRQWGGVIR
jgi:hypothetical protein